MIKGSNYLVVVIDLRLRIEGRKYRDGGCNKFSYDKLKLKDCIL